MSSYKSLLKLAAKMNLEWDNSFYDPVGLSQLIEEAAAMENSAKCREKINYYNSRL